MNATLSAEDAAFYEKNIHPKTFGIGGVIGFLLWAPDFI